MATQANLDAVQKLYIAYLGRAADQAGLNFWANAIESGVSTGLAPTKPDTKSPLN